MPWHYQHQLHCYHRLQYFLPVSTPISPSLSRLVTILKCLCPLGLMAYRPSCLTPLVGVTLSTHRIWAWWWRTTRTIVSPSSGPMPTFLAFFSITIAQPIWSLHPSITTVHAVSIEPIGRRRTGILWPISSSTTTDRRGAWEWTGKCWSSWLIGGWYHNRILACVTIPCSAGSDLRGNRCRGKVMLQRGCLSRSGRMKSQYGQFFYSFTLNSLTVCTDDRLKVTIIKCRMCSKIFRTCNIAAVFQVFYFP